MAFDFPNSPTTVGQTFTPSGGPTYVWNGYAWDIKSVTDANARLDAYDEVFSTKLDTRWCRAGTDWSFTENNLRVTKIGGGGAYIPVFSELATLMFPCLYFEATIMQRGSGPMIGLANRNHSPAVGQYPGIGAYSGGWHWNGTWYNGGSTSAAVYPTFNTGDTIAIAVHQSIGNLWIRNVTTNTPWNNNAAGAADPSAAPPTGFVAGAWVYNMGPIAVLCTPYDVGESIRFNFDGPFLGTVPTGYRRWKGRLP